MYTFDIISALGLILTYHIIKSVYDLVQSVLIQ